MDIETIEAREAEYQQETFLFLRAIRDYSQGFEREELIGPGCDEPSIDVRLQVYPDGSFAFHSGDSSYDQDHRGAWGASCVGPDDDERTLIETARDLVSQAIDMAYDMVEA
jgi:hypothetical protein